MSTSLTEYVILQLDEDLSGSLDSHGMDLWSETARITARSVPAALREHGKAGTFVAVPVRNWQPVTLVEKVQRRLEVAPIESLGADVGVTPARS